jgi:hypothetical protein
MFKALQNTRFCRPRAARRAVQGAESWRIGSGRHVFRLRDSKGVAYLAELLDWMEGTIAPLGPLETGLHQRSISIDPDNDGRYELYFNLTHGFDQ